MSFQGGLIFSQMPKDQDTIRGISKEKKLFFRWKRVKKSLIWEPGEPLPDRGMILVLFFSQSSPYWVFCFCLCYFALLQKFNETNPFTLIPLLFIFKGKTGFSTSVCVFLKKILYNMPDTQAQIHLSSISFPYSGQIWCKIQRSFLSTLQSIGIAVYLSLHSIQSWL